MPDFCFAKSDLRVLEGILRKSGRKVNDIVEKTWNSFVSKTTTFGQVQKSENEIGIFFVIQHVAFFKVTLQQIINMMCKIREYDACWTCVKILNFGSKTFKMLEFTPRIDLLLRDIQHFLFRKNALFRFWFDEFTWPQHYGTPKIWHKISHSEKSVEFLLTKLDMR